jgi:hypothetical protein
VFAIKIVDCGGRWGNTAQGLAQWWQPVASSEDRDVLHQPMCPESYRRIHMVIKITRKVGVLFCIIYFVVVNNLR